MVEYSSPEADLQNTELGRLLEQEIDQLPEGLRSVLVLRDVIELDTAETARCLGIGEDNVRVRVHRARQTLASCLSALATDHASVWRFGGERCAHVLAHVMVTSWRRPESPLGERPGLAFAPPITHASPDLARARVSAHHRL